MATSSFPLLRKASLSLGIMLHRSRVARRPTSATMAAGFTPSDTEHVEPESRVAVLVETTDVDSVTEAVGASADVQALSERYVSVQASVAAVAGLAADRTVRRVQTKKQSQPNLTGALPDIGLAAPSARPRPVAEDGTGVLIGVVDSGFDLSHPMFRDANGKLRVDGLLDQTAAGGAREFNNATLQRRWAGGRGPGADDNGHGTHVATIAGGSRFGGLEGVAPGARFLLVKTDFTNTDDAVAWIFNRAAGTPCVVNMSLGHHWGSHDGTDAEERLHRELAGPGRIIVISAGNERADDIHIGGRFNVDQADDVPFDLQRQPDGGAFVVLTLWHSREDRFDVALVTPGGEVFVEPGMGRGAEHSLANVAIEIGQQRYAPSGLVQHQIAVEVRGGATSRELRNWRVRISCRRAAVGRLDGWFHNSGFAAFRAHPLLESARTVGLSATGDGCLSVASHVTRNEWDADAGDRRDNQAVLGRFSAFSSVGPTRDGRQKPDVSAPGQMLTAALAGGSEMSRDDRFALTSGRLLTIAGTSMAAPIVAGAVALLLQQKPGRTVEAIRDVLRRTVRRDAHTGPGPWDPNYGLGKLDVAVALREP